MSATRFQLPIGAKRQVTIPSKAMELLSLQEGDSLFLEIDGDYAVLQPAVSVPRSELPDDLWKKFAARRGTKPTDISLESLMAEIRPHSAAGNEKAHAAKAAARGLSSASAASAAPRKRRLRPIVAAGSVEHAAAKA